VEQGSSKGANISLDRQEIPRIFGTPSIIPVFRRASHLLSQMNHVLALPFYFLKIHFNIILHLCLGLQVLSSLKVSPPKPIYTRPLPYVPHVLPTSFCYSNVVCVGVRIIKLLTMTFSLCPCYFLRLSPKYVSRQTILIPSVYVSSSV